MLVTVYITTYNRQPLLKRAIESVENQTHKNIQIVVADDGSTDGSHEYLESLQAEGKITAVINKTVESRGACYGRNQAIALAKGTFITGLDDDDYFEPWRVETFLKKWFELEAKEIQFSALFDSVVEHRKYGIVNCYDTSVVTNNSLRTSNILGNQVFTRVEYLQEIGGFDEKMPALQDWDTWLRLTASKGDIYNINSRSYIQIHDHGGTRISEKPAHKIRYAFERLMTKLSPLGNKERAALLNNMYGYEQIDNKFHEIVTIFFNGYFRKVAQIINRTYFKKKH